MDNQIMNLPECQYKFDECDKTGRFLFNQKWCCGKCLIKMDNKIKEIRARNIMLVEKELRDGNTQED